MRYVSFDIPSLSIKTMMNWLVCSRRMWRRSSTGGATRFSKEGPIISYLTNDEILASQEVADRINDWVATWQQENRENNVIYLGLYSEMSKQLGVENEGISSTVHLLCSHFQQQYHFIGK